MDVRKYEIYFECHQDIISRVSKANDTRNNFIFKSIAVLFCLLYKK